MGEWFHYKMHAVAVRRSSVKDGDRKRPCKFDVQQQATTTPKILPIMFPQSMLVHPS